MLSINHWPDMATIPLPYEISQDIYSRLLEPFISEQEAREFWQDAPSTIIILEPTDTFDTLQGSDAWTNIEFALAYPEYDVPLSNGYLMLVAITNDSGGGIYLVIPPKLLHLTQSYEVADHE